MKSIKILVAEDQQDIAEILSAYLKKEDFDVILADNGRDAVSLFHTFEPSLVILDIKMPLMDGWQVLNEIRRTHNIPVMMITALDADIDKIHALRNGADDYIVKPFNPAEIVARVHVILRRMSLYTSDRTLSLHATKNIEVNISDHSVIVKNTNTDIARKLTSTEFKILVHLIRYPKRVFTRHELLDHCLPESDACERTVDSHISKLRKKFEQAGLANIPESIRGFGYRLGD
ncbi:response regulator [Enterobacteriaceae bacterium H18W14]|uniref:response regulator n=1 Tax=Dryocola boscaweniae TaxID=2925397 RepID=UPI0022F01B60|nr:response regulator [Dryocola boscaweniae]MCT4715460.1 response regulator [Dryocola boscaweniae]